MQIAVTEWLGKGKAGNTIRLDTNDIEYVKETAEEGDDVAWLGMKSGATLWVKDLNRAISISISNAKEGR